ncbi:ribosomal protein S18 acetylase RimI-like enzyme [Deinobacterium chartae]|uniref:Ribosomal protein S18 acetylase RimI-like enzyme n=1 Tax=Deinobacterium chartae TaxID=521158 RepID=A0A841HYE7_9DEIO|nr:GNAT family N-acetyltransferase [Deinobacterium chartae]MBB6097240.1 ribosomal protein S18 acetylase RimI-like enzyme [Deinobacterium chartae]
MTVSRIAMRLALTPQPADSVLPVRPLRADDVPALGELMYAAYLNTVDYEPGSTAADAAFEVQRTLDGAYGRFLEAASFVAEADGRPVAAVLTTDWPPFERPLIAFMLTHPDYQRRGLARSLMNRVMNALLELGYPEVSLVVTVANTPALTLYQKMGFGQFHPPRSQPQD